MQKRKEIHIRDPFIVPVWERGFYYMYGTNGGIWGEGQKFWVYKTEDLENFSDPILIFDAQAVNFWADRNFWAPELHRYNGKYYLFASFKAKGKCRGTQILASDSPEGPFEPLTEFPVTPADWECLDGTFWVENGTPYIVFCHEWEQVGDGEIWAMPLTEDLKASAGAPQMLFRASDSPYVNEYPKPNCYVTDGPFVFREEERLKMIWSSFYDGRYVVLEAESESGSLLGPWKQYDSRFPLDGGHAMLFYKLDGTRMIALHSPNDPQSLQNRMERAVFFEY
jgi:GH43 family beta-xylosidase